MISVKILSRATVDEDVRSERVNWYSYTNTHIHIHTHTLYDTLALEQSNGARTRRKGRRKSGANTTNFYRPFFIPRSPLTSKETVVRLESPWWRVWARIITCSRRKETSSKESRVERTTMVSSKVFHVTAENWRQAGEDACVEVGTRDRSGIIPIRGLTANARRNVMLIVRTSKRNEASRIARRGWCRLRNP